MHSVAVSVSNDPLKLKAEVIQLRDVVKEKEQLLATKEQALSEKAQRIEQLLDYILLLRKRQFGAKADRPNKDQISLFDEAELEQLLADLGLAEDPDEAKPAAAKKASGEKKKPVRRALPANLKRIEKIIDLSDEEKATMGNGWTFIGYDTSEQLAVIPRQHYVITYKRAKYAPDNDDVAGAEDGIRIAPRAEQILPKSIAHSSVIADVVVRKFADEAPVIAHGGLFFITEVDDLFNALEVRRQGATHRRFLCSARVLCRSGFSLIRIVSQTQIRQQLFQFGFVEQ